MKTRIKLMALVAGLLAVLPMTSAWAGSDYYATLNVAVSTKSPSGAGSVYASTSSAATSGDASATGSANSTASSASVKVYGFAVPNTGFQFDGWSEKPDGSGTLTSETKYTYTVTSSSTSSPGPTKSIYAVFSKIVLPEFSVTCADGNYTVNGGAPGTLTQTEAVTVTLASADPNFFCWKINGTSYTDNPHVQTFSTGATISAQFLTAESVAEVTTYADLKTRLGDEKTLKVVVPSGLSFTVGENDALTVPSGKLLVVDGVLYVEGKVQNDGEIAGSGTVAKLWKRVTQSSEIKIAMSPKVEEVYGKETINKVVDANGDPIIVTNFKYRVTTVQEGKGAISGNGKTCDTKSYVVVSNGAGGEFYPYVDVSTCKGLKCSVKTDIAKNHISGIDGAITDISSDAGSGKMYLLLSDVNVPTTFTYKDGNEWNMNSTVDCAGSKLTGPNIQTKSRFNSTILNGKFSIYVGSWSSQEAFNCQFNFINCKDINLGSVKSASTSSRFRFYDCGPKITWSYERSTTGNGTPFMFFSGTYSDIHAFDAHTLVIGGSFTNDPNPDPDNGKTYLIDKANFYAPKVGNYYVVQLKPKAVDIVKIERDGSEVKFTSLADALADARAGEIVDLIENVTISEMLEIDKDKNVVLNLNGLSLSGVGIENNGTLYMVDSDIACDGNVTCPIVNNGVMDITFGTYSGGLENGSSGTLTVHNGKISKSFVNNGQVSLRGGHFPCDITSMIPAANYYVKEKSSSEYIATEAVNSKMYATTVSTCPGYGIQPYSEYDFTLLKKCVCGVTARGGYSSFSEWQRVAELYSFYEAWNSYSLDATLLVDRDVEPETLKMHGYAGLTKSELIDDRKIQKGEYFRGLTYVRIKSGQATVAMRYSELFPNDINDVRAAISDQTSSRDNHGTTCTLMIELWERNKVGSNGAYETNTVKILASQRFVLGAGENVAMIRPTEGAATFYPTLKAACEAAKNGETVMLCNDCTTCDPIAAECSFKFDANGFKFDGEIAAEEDYTISVENGVYTIKKLVIELPQNTEPAGEGESKPQVSIVPDVDLIKKAKEAAGPNATQEEIAKKVQEKLEEPEDNGLKVWENKLLEQATDEQKESKVVVQVVEKTVGEQKVVEARQVAVETKDGYDKLEAGTYREAFTVNDAAGQPVKIADPDAKSIAVVKNTSTEKTIILPVPGEKNEKSEGVSIDNVIAPGSMNVGDIVTFYDGDTKLEWRFLGGEGENRWENKTTNKDGVDVTKPAKDCTLSPGNAFWLTRAAPEKPVVIVAEVSTEGIEKPVTAGEWNLEANPDPVSEKTLDDVVKNAGENDTIIIPTANGVQKKVTRNDKGEWTYRKSSVVNGRVVTTPTKATVRGGQGFWYISGSKDSKETSIRWK